MEEPDPGHDGRSVLLLDRTGGTHDRGLDHRRRTPRGRARWARDRSPTSTPSDWATVLAALAERTGLEHRRRRRRDLRLLLAGRHPERRPRPHGRPRRRLPDHRQRRHPRPVLLDRGSPRSTWPQPASCPASRTWVAGGAEMMSSYKQNAPKNRNPFMDNEPPPAGPATPDQPGRRRRRRSPRSRASAPPSTLWPPSRSVGPRSPSPKVASSARSCRVLDEDGTVALDREEYPRSGTTVDSLAQLPASFERARRHAARRGRHHVPGDGPGATLAWRSSTCTTPGTLRRGRRRRGDPGDEPRVRAHGMTLRARVRAIANMGDDLTLMLNAPVPATRKVLERRRA